MVGMNIQYRKDPETRQWLARYRHFGVALGDGKTRKEAKEQLRECFEAWVETCFKLNGPIITGKEILRIVSETKEGEWSEGEWDDDEV